MQAVQGQDFKLHRHQVQITDQKTLNEFAPKYQNILLQMEKEGVSLSLGRDSPDDVETLDSVYLSPNIPRIP